MRVGVDEKTVATGLGVGSESESHAASAKVPINAYTPTSIPILSVLRMLFVLIRMSRFYKSVFISFAKGQSKGIEVILWNLFQSFGDAAA